MRASLVKTTLTVVLATAGFVAVSALLGGVDVIAAVIFATVVATYLGVSGARARNAGA